MSASPSAAFAKFSVANKARESIAGEFVAAFIVLTAFFNEDKDYLLRLVQFLNRHRLGDVRSVDKTAWWF